MNALSIYRKLEKYPFGKWIFLRLTCFKAPYFGTVKPLFTELKPGRCVIFMKKRRAVTNHIKTVHAIAMCNIVELAGGMCIDISLPKEKRWIPRNMTVEYITFAKTDLIGVCEIDLQQLSSWDMKKLFPVVVNLNDTSGKIVMRGTVEMYLSMKK